MNKMKYKWYTLEEVNVKKGDFIFNSASGKKGIVTRVELGKIYYTNEDKMSCSWGKNEDITVLKEVY
ncbi:hypothetical protein PP657_gp050 [Bacillus phage BCPST]|uniref:Uncharacterized protein n=1 Tax=Bacillus phage BCPST TaxID=2801506 RepID=A0AAE7TQV6_9CAUD|nr:hypothetical protein PP657_gp050 [Bacillus phage BCPST]QQO38668.1 hypothetical protein BCPST_050 [Bacillus phage BCPST]QSJ04259.1 hypothetical protein BCP6_054 [Bacillus phage BCP6]